MSPESKTALGSLTWGWKPIEPLVPMDHRNCPVPSQATRENNLSPLNETHINQKNHWNDIIFYWYQSYHWYQWTPFLSPLTPMESICEYWTTLPRHVLHDFKILVSQKTVPVSSYGHCRIKQMCELLKEHEFLNKRWIEWKTYTLNSSAILCV